MLEDSKKSEIVADVRGVNRAKTFDFTLFNNTVRVEVLYLHTRGTLHTRMEEAV